MGDTKADHRAVARSRARTPKEHLWCIALAVGPDDHSRSMWEACDGTPVDITRHITELSEHLAQPMTVSGCMSDPRVRAGEAYCRPVGARGYGYCVRDGRVIMVPTLTGGTPVLTFTAEELAGPWEIVDAETMLDRGGSE